MYFDNDIILPVITKGLFNIKPKNRWTIKPGEIEEIKNSLINFCDYKKDWDIKAKTAKKKIDK